MKTISETSLDSVQSAASAWIVRRDAGLSPDEQRAFERWLAAAPRHLEAFAAQERAWAALDRPALAGQAGYMRREYRARVARRMRRRVSNLAVAATLVFCVGLFWFNRTAPTGPVLSESSTALVVKPTGRLLDDGSRVELRGGASIDVKFEPATRRILLAKGEAHFNVAPQPERPFIVAAGEIEVRAVGTAFTVDLHDTSVDVLVTEGRIAASRPGEPDVLVDAGQQVTLSRTPHREPVTPVALPAAEIDERLSWLQVHLEFNETPLSEATKLFNAHSNGSLRLEIDGPAAGAIPVTGFFRTDNVEVFVKLIEVGAGVKATRRGDVIHLRKVE